MTQLSEQVDEIGLAKGRYLTARWMHGADSAEAKAAHAEMSTARLRGQAARIAAAWPPLSAEQRRRVLAVLQAALAADDHAAAAS